VSDCRDPKTGLPDPDCPECAKQRREEDLLLDRSRLGLARRLAALAMLGGAISPMHEGRSPVIGAKRPARRGRSSKARPPKGTKPRERRWSLRPEGGAR